MVLENKSVVHNDSHSLDADIEARILEDTIEQRSLRNTLRINGIAESENENLVEKISSIGVELDIPVDANRITSIYRGGSKGKFKNKNVPRPIILKFSDFSDKLNFLRKKKSLAQSNGFKKCHIYSDLTFLKWKLFYYLKGLDSIGTVYIRGGSIMAKAVDEEEVHVVNSIKDLAWLKLESLDLEALGFSVKTNNL